MPSSVTVNARSTAIIVSAATSLMTAFCQVNFPELDSAEAALVLVSDALAVGTVVDVRSREGIPKVKLDSGKP